jgi:DNA-binding Lrp family transcriptional regulator
MVLVGGGNQVYINAFLKNPSEIEPYMEFVKEAGCIPRPVFGIHTLRPDGLKLAEGTGEISPLELRIIGSLRRDSRKKLSDVAVDVGVSARTVGNKLSRLTEGGKVRFTIDWSPHFSRDVVSLLHLHLAEGVERSKAFALLRERFSENIVLTSAFSNVPDLMLATAWTPSMSEIEAITKSMYGSGLFSDIVPYPIYFGHRFETWKDRLTEQKASARKS